MGTDLEGFLYLEPPECPCLKIDSYLIALTVLMGTGYPQKLALLGLIFEIRQFRDLVRKVPNFKLPTFLDRPKAAKSELMAVISLSASQP